MSTPGKQVHLDPSLAGEIAPMLDQIDRPWKSFVALGVAPLNSPVPRIPAPTKSAPSGAMPTNSTIAMIAGFYVIVMSWGAGAIDSPKSSFLLCLAALASFIYATIQARRGQARRMDMFYDGLLICGATLLFHIGKFFGIYRAMEWRGAEPHFGLVIATVVGLYLIFSVGSGVRCPRCSDCHAGELLSTLYAQDSGYELQTRSLQHYDSKFQHLGHTDYEVVVPVTNTQVMRSYSCKYCDHNFSITKSR